MNIIIAEGLRKTYKTYKKATRLFKREAVYVNAVDGISFTVEEGSICGLLGPNGAGKSTTVKMLCGALFPSGGRLEVMGFSPARDRKRYVAHIGAVYGQKSQLIWDIPPLDSFKMNRAIYNIPLPNYKKVLDELAELLDVYDVLEKPTRVLSLGERMKCEFIMAMLHDPKIVFLDEPTIGLDVIAKAGVRSFIRKMNARGTTFILTTHDLEDVEQLAGQIIIINHGLKIFDDHLTHLRRQVGDKKQISLTLHTPPNPAALEGIQITNRTTDLELTLEADTTDIGGFMESLFRRFSVRDISVKEQPIEDIISVLYAKKLPY
jgi:ABC-2 type transport system ATP-binding protein